MQRDESDPMDLIRDFLKSNGYKSTLECFEAEDKNRLVNTKTRVALLFRKLRKSPTS